VLVHRAEPAEHRAGAHVHMPGQRAR
jgi:hypothetical protein